MTRDLKLGCLVGKHIQRGGIQGQEDLSRESISDRELQVHRPQGIRQLGVGDFKRMPEWPEWRVWGREAQGKAG